MWVIKNKFMKKLVSFISFFGQITRASLAISGSMTKSTGFPLNSASTGEFELSLKEYDLYFRNFLFILALFKL